MATHTVHPLFSDFLAQPPFVVNEPVTGQQGWSASPTGVSMVISATGADAVAGAAISRNYFVFPAGTFDATQPWTATCIAVPLAGNSTCQIEMNITTTLAVGNKCSVLFNVDGTVSWSIASNVPASTSDTLSFTADGVNVAIITMHSDGAGNLSLSFNGTLLGTIANSTALACTTLRLTNNAIDAGDSQSIKLVSITQPTTVTTSSTSHTGVNGIHYTGQ